MDPIIVRVAQRRTYGIVDLADGRILAFDRRDRTPVYLMTKSPAADGQYPLARSGSLIVRGGLIAQVVDPARSTTHTLYLDAAGNLVAHWCVPPPGGAERRFMPNRRVAPIIIDLRDGGLMLLEGSRAFRLLLRPAPDGAYNAPPLGSLVVRGGTVSESTADPDIEFVQDFQP